MLLAAILLAAILLAAARCAWANLGAGRQYQRFMSEYRPRRYSDIDLCAIECPRPVHYYALFG